MTFREAITEGARDAWRTMKRGLIGAVIGSAVIVSGEVALGHSPPHELFGCAWERWSFGVIITLQVAAMLWLSWRNGEFE